MSTARQRRGLEGLTSLRKKLRRMDDESTLRIRKEIEAGAREIERDQLGGVPVDEGDLALSISYKIGNDGFTAVVGPAADSVQIKRGFGMADRKYTKAGNLTAATIRSDKARFNLYKAHWIEFGTKQGLPGSSAQPARPFIQPAWDANRDRIAYRVRSAVTQVLREASDG